MNQNNPSGPFALYWQSYGGLAALLKSGYLWSSLLITLVCYHLWSKEGWWEDIITIIPSLIGFSLAAFAMLLAFTNEGFLKIITTPLPGAAGLEKPSVYASTGAAFVHFILVQFVALIGGIACKAFYVPVPNFVGNLIHKMGMETETFVTLTRSLWFVAYWVFIYSLLSGVAATMRVYLLAHWFNKASRIENTPNDPESSGGTSA